MKRYIRVSLIIFFLSATIFTGFIPSSADENLNKNKKSENLIVNENYDDEVDELEIYNNTINELFKTAQKKQSDGNFLSAINDYQAILDDHPFLHRVRLELAAALYQNHRYEEAVKQAQKVLDAPETPVNVRTTILAFIAQVQHDAQIEKSSR